MKYDVVIIGGGLAGLTAGVKLLQSGLSVIAVSEGLSLNETPRAEFISLGGLILNGDSVIGGEFEDDRLKFVRTRNLGDTRLEADNFILSTGKFFSKGICSDMDRVFEPLFGCDVYYLPDRSDWTVPDFFERQPFEDFGVESDEKSRVSIKGKTVSNLYAAGEVLKGNIDIVESALKVCRNII